MTEKTKKALAELVRAVLAALVAFATAMLTVSCGSTTRAIVQNRADGTSTTVTITTNNPTSWEIAPEVKLDSIKNK